MVFHRARNRILKFLLPVQTEDQDYFETLGRRLLITLFGISLLYVLIQIRACLQVPQAVELGDTTSYLEGAGMRLSDPAFFSERRPWGILLIYKLLRGSLAAIGPAQLAFSTVAWLFLAWILIGSFKTKIGKLLAFVVVLGISLSPAVQVWNHAGLSESFSVSILILILALFVALLQNWKWLYFFALMFFFVLWVSIHEVNLYLGLLAAIFLFIIGLTRKNFRIFLILSISIAGMLFVNARLSSFYALPRWALPVAEVITRRILPVPAYLEYFSSQGMPLPPELMALSGQWANSNNYAILNNPRLRPFSKWLFKDGQKVYVRFLITHPIYTLTLPLANLDQMLAVDFSYLIPGYKPALPGIVNGLFFPKAWFWLFLGLSLPLLGFVLWKQHSEKSRVYWLIVLFFALSIPYLYLAWHGDPLDLARHAAVANIQFHLGLWLLLLVYLDQQLIRIQNKIL